MKTWIQLAQQQSKIFELAIPLIIGETYTISMNSNEPFIIYVGDVFVGETVDGSLEFIATNSGDVMITSYGDISMEFEIKLELGSRTEWSPAPEDGYGLDLPNGAYHIQGDDSFSKTVVGGVQSSVHAYAWRTMALNGVPLPINDTERYRGDSNKLEFSGTDLDFIAYDPVISTDSLIEYPAQSTEVSNVFNPISQVQVYWDDVSAFEAGTGIGSTIVINTPWATQASTDYIHSILNGYQYIPAQGTRVYADPAIQLGDTFTYGTINQLVASVVWHFDGAVTGNFDAPQNNDSNFDDPREILIANAFKKKVSLGDSYQGVSIGRQDGIQMLLSPDGSEENAIGRYYANLNEGMAFQTRDTIMSPWQNWLYFDMQEKVFKLSLYSTTEEDNQRFTAIEADLDSINATVSNISFGNIIGNFNPENYLGWEGGSRLLYVAEYSKLRYLNGLTYAMGFQPVRMAGSLSEWGLSFFNNGSATSPFGYVVPTENYSYRAKVQRFKPFSIDLLEFKDMVTPFHKSTRFTFNAPQSYVQFTSALDPETVFVRIKFNVTGVTPSDRLEIAENMYNRGLPKEYFVSGTEALVYAQSNINILDNKIGLVVDEVKAVDSKTEINKANITIQGDEIKSTVQRVGQAESSITQNANEIALKASQISLDATNVEVSGKVSFTDLSTGGSTIINGANITTGKIKAEYLDFNNATGTNVNLTGKITATSGKIAGFNISGNNLIGSDIGIRPNEVSIGSSKMYKSSADDYELVIEGGGISIQTGSGKVASIRLGSHIFAQEFTGLGVVMNTVHRMLPIKTTGTSAIGGSTRRYEYIYLTNQPDVASDARYKNDIQDIDPFLLDMIAKYVIPKRYETQFDDKLHFGYIAQDVEMALYQYFYQSSVLNGMNKLEASRFANTQIAQFAFLSKSESYMSLLYGEIAVIMDAYNRSRIDELEERLTKLELML